MNGATHTPEHDGPGLPTPAGRPEEGRPMSDDDAALPAGDSGRYYNRAGQEIPVQRWRELCSHVDYSVLADTPVGSGLRVLTVWQGLDLGDGAGDGGPQIFETFVDGVGRRSVWADGPFRIGGEFYAAYAVEADAVAGHEVMCSRVRAWLVEATAHPE